MGSGREAWRELSTRPFVFGGQEESHMAASVQAQYPATAKGEGGGGSRDSLGFFLSPELLKLDPYLSSEACLNV